MKRIVLYLVAISALLLSCNNQNEPQYPPALRKVLTSMSYGDSVLIVGHKSPDCDVTAEYDAQNG